MTDFRIWQIVGWTMLHYLWVGGVLGIIAVVLRRGLRRAGSNLRYLAALSSFTVLGIAPLPIAVVVTNSLPPLPQSGPVADRMPMLPALPPEEIPAESAVTLPTPVSSPPPPPCRKQAAGIIKNNPQKPLFERVRRVVTQNAGWASG